jgi:histidinol-phosphate aminotransferase
LTCSPTFVQFAALTEIRGGRVVDIARREDFSLDVDAIRRAVAEHRPKLLMLASPNTPDGSRLPDEVTDLLLSLPVLVLLDEAYVEYSDPNGLGAAHTRFRQVLELDNLVTLRTFSKWAGLAGLRIGYGAFPERLRRAVVRRRLPFSVNAMAQAAAVASLVDVEDPRTKVRRITVERERLRGELARIPGFSPFPSCANFVLTRIDERIAGRSAAELARELEEAGVLVRHCAAETLPDCLRITSGRAQDTDALLDALRRILRIAG